MFRVWTSARYAFPLPDGHRFPIAKYALLREQVLIDGIVTPDAMREPERALRDGLLLAHTADYVDSFASGTLSERDMRRIGFPWSPPLVERSLRAVGGTCEAAAAALDDGVSMNLGGGTHHAFADHGEGFCVFNDIAVAIRVLRAESALSRAAVVDLDVHQGNGTAAIFADDPEVFTLSLHGEKNYPLVKQQSTLDVALADGTDDEEYLYALALHLATTLDGFRPDIVFYQAGVDPFFDDRLGRLALTLTGLKRRDEMVLAACRARQLPCVITLGGGYAREV